MRLDTVLKEEQSWSDQANVQRTMSLAFIVGCGVISVLACCFGACGRIVGTVASMNLTSRTSIGATFPILPCTLR